MDKSGSRSLRQSLQGARRRLGHAGRAGRTTI